MSDTYTLAELDDLFVWEETHKQDLRNWLAASPPQSMMVGWQPFADAKI